MAKLVLSLEAGGYNYTTRQDGYQCFDTLQAPDKTTATDSTDRNRDDLERDVWKKAGINFELVISLFSHHGLSHIFNLTRLKFIISFM